jgi:hypothetical protein
MRVWSKEMKLSNVLERTLKAIFIAVLLIATTPALAEHQHTLGASYQLLQIHTDSKRTYTFHSPAVNYGLVLGSAWAFTSNVAFFIPVYGLEDGSGIAVNDYYTSHYGIDLSLGAIRRIPLTNALEASFGAMMHVNWIEMSGKTGYANFRNISLALV